MLRREGNSQLFLAFMFYKEMAIFLSVFVDVIAEIVANSDPQIIRWETEISMKSISSLDAVEQPVSGDRMVSFIVGIGHIVKLKESAFVIVAVKVSEHLFSHFRFGQRSVLNLKGEWVLL